MLKILATALLAFGSTAFAETAQTSTYCNEIQLSTQQGQVSLFISQDGALDATKPFSLEAYKVGGEGGAVKIQGLNVEIAKSALFDEITEANCGRGCYRSDVKVYTTKITVKADETIGIQIQGDVGIPTNQISDYVICRENTTTTIR